jgi:hypothetical protein
VTRKLQTSRHFLAEINADETFVYINVCNNVHIPSYRRGHVRDLRREMLLTITDVPVASGAAPATPPRQCWSVRRTSTIQTTWSDGPANMMHMSGHARDLLTTGDLDGPTVLAEDRFVARLTADRTITDLSVAPERPGAASLVGARAGRQLRSDIATAFAAERARVAPLYLLLDDIAGASLVAPSGLKRWKPLPPPSPAERAEADRRLKARENVCIGFSSGSPVLQGDLAERAPGSRLVLPLDGTDDANAWHQFDRHNGPSARRSRRIDVRFEGNLVHVDSYFRDDYPLQAGGRQALHEYLLYATIDRSEMVIRSIRADPRILPFDYCPSAILSLDRIVGTSASTLRERVLETFPGPRGCTHLNDMIRALAEVPHLATALATAQNHQAGAVAGR